MAAKVVTYPVALAELTLAMVVFARTLHVGRTSALAAALLAALLVFPFYGTDAIYPIAALAPHDVTFIAVTLLIASAFPRFGRRGVLQDLPYAAAVLVLTLWFVHAAVVVLVLAGPSLFIAGISGLFAARGWPERRAKLGLIASAAAIMILGGPIAYLFGLLSIPHR